MVCNLFDGAHTRGSERQLLETTKTTEKMYKLDDHIGAAVAGITADANILINTARRVGHIWPVAPH